ncbi:TPM domain-containing protein [uncultured Intestinimonas sp.]|uniref:TPM domain-containing protein n=1 Tax=uncultured Intestinimonas sp. TaxID=1689265 RepID=UPI0025D39C17|nr:TPM domain-containing protein [uncultured Intestinimonas sp.]
MLKKRWVAVVITLVVIGLAICFGLMKAQSGSDLPAEGSGALDTALDTSSYTRFLYDQADLLSPSAEETILLYNANWDDRYNSVVAVVTLESVGTSSLEDAAYDQGADMGLGEGDAVLLIAVAEDSYYVAPGTDFATILTNQAVDELESRLNSAPNYESAVLSFFSGMDTIYQANFGLGNQEVPQGGGYVFFSGYRWLVSLIALLLVLFVILSAIDSARYNAYRRMYYGVPNPPVVFRPIFFWHGPGYGWYQRRWRRPPPPRTPSRRSLLRLRRRGEPGAPGRRHLRGPSLRRRQARRLWRLLWGLPGRGLRRGPERRLRGRPVRRFRRRQPRRRLRRPAVTPGYANRINMAVPPGRPCFLPSTSFLHICLVCCVLERRGSPCLMSSWWWRTSPA